MVGKKWTRHNVVARRRPPTKRYPVLQTLTAAARVADASRVAIYDKLDWHFDSAVSAGQPPENAFTHIGFYLAWLIRHDLHNSRLLPPEHVEAVKRGEMTGSDLADDIDTKLVSQVMNGEGRAFSDGRYGTYTTEYGKVFKDLPDYGVVDDDSNYRLAEQLLDRLYGQWVAEGRPKAPPEPPFEGDIPASTSVSVMLPPGFSEDQLGELLAPRGDTELTAMGPPTEEQMPHRSPELEALIPRDLTSPAMQVSSVSATDWGSSLLKRALKRLEIRPKDAIVVNGLGGKGEQTLTVSIYGVPNLSAERLEAEFQSVIFRLPGSTWQRRDIAGRQVNWASGREFNVAFWARDGVVIHVAGEVAAVERAVERLA